MIVNGTGEQGEIRTITLVENEDAELVRQTLAGTTSAYDCLMRKYQRQVYSLVYRMLGNADDACDLTQDTFLRAYSALGSFRQDASFLTWLYKIASNLCIDLMRSRQKKSTLSLDVERSEGREPVADDRMQAPEAAACLADMQNVVQREVMNLPDRYRVVVVMRHLQGLGVDEIADKLEMPSGTVKTHLFRAREMLRERLGPLLEVINDGKSI